MAAPTSMGSEKWGGRSRAQQTLESTFWQRRGALGANSADIDENVDFHAEPEMLFRPMSALCSYAMQCRTLHSQKPGLSLNFHIRPSRWPPNRAYLRPPNAPCAC